MDGGAFRNGGAFPALWQTVGAMETPNVAQESLSVTAARFALWVRQEQLDTKAAFPPFALPRKQFVGPVLPDSAGHRLGCGQCYVA